MQAFARLTPALRSSHASRRMYSVCSSHGDGEGQSADGSWPAALLLLVSRPIGCPVLVHIILWLLLLSLSTMSMMLWWWA